MPEESPTEETIIQGFAPESTRERGVSKIEEPLLEKLQTAKEAIVAVLDETVRDRELYRIKELPLLDMLLSAMAKIEGSTIEVEREIFENRCKNLDRIRKARNVETRPRFLVFRENEILQNKRLEVLGRQVDRLQNARMINEDTASKMREVIAMPEADWRIK